MRTVGYIPEEDTEQEKEPVTEQAETPTPPELKTDETETPTPPEPTDNTGKKGGEKE